MYITYYVLLLDVFVVVTDGTSGVSAV